MMIVLRCCLILTIIRLLQEIQRNCTIIIIGETGSGKTTQIPQFLHESGLVGGCGAVAVTQVVFSTFLVVLIL